MIERIILFSLRNRFLVLVLVGLLIGLGIYNLKRLPIDAIPDITNIQVQILTNAPALSPLEVEQFITFPVEQSMSGLPKVTEIRSVSKPGLSAVTVVFEDGTDIYWARQLILERLQEVRELIPEEWGDVEMGPISTGLGEIYQFEVRGKGYSLMELRTILDWYIAYQLRSVPGVVEVNTFGGELKTYEVQLDAKKLRSYKIGINQVFEALERNNMNAGGAYIEHAGEAYYIRGEGLIQSLMDIENIVVESREDGAPIYIKNLARVTFAPMVRQGAVTRDGRGEIVTGIVMMLMGENSRVVVDRVKEKIEEIKKTLPKGVTIDTFYDRTELVRKTIKTVTKNLAEGALLVIAVLLLLLGSIKGGVIIASAIPLSMMVAFTAMVQAGISGNLMSLGAIDFGLIVDGSVVMIENFFRHFTDLKNRQRKPYDVTRQAALEVARPVTFAVGIIMIVYLPIMTLQGVEGKMFRPMAFTVVFALAGSLILALTLMPVLGYLFLKTGFHRTERSTFDVQLSTLNHSTLNLEPRTSNVHNPEPIESGHHETFIIRWIKKAYIPILSKAVRHPSLTVSIAAAIFIASLMIARTMGAEFIPELDEGAIALQAWRLPSVSLEQSIKNTTMIEKVLKRFPEMETVISKTGRAEIATDPMGVEISDIFVMLKPKEEWTTVKTREDLIAAIDEALKREIPGTMFSYSQPIELRMNELIAGVRSDVAIKLYGEDLDVLKAKADEIVRVVSRVAGAEDVKAEQVAGLPLLRIRVRRNDIARYGINASDIIDTVSAMGGKIIGQVFEGQKRFFLQLRLSKEDRNDLERINNIPIADSRGRLIPLSQLADIWVEDGPAQISREKIQRRITVELNVRGRDIASFVAEAKKRIGEQIQFPPGYTLDWGGQFKNLERASRRLMIVVPLAIFLIFVLLYTTFGSARPAILIYLNIPMAATGGIFALALRGMPFSISAGVGFIALFGVAVMNGVVLISHINQLKREGKETEEAVLQGSLEKMRAMIMAPLVAALGFIPMALSTSEGAEVQRPLATVVIGGLITSTMLTLLVLPAIYHYFEKDE